MMGAELRSMRKVKRIREERRNKYVTVDYVFDTLFEYQAIYRKTKKQTIKDNVLSIKNIELFRLGSDLLEEEVKCKKFGKGVIDDYNFMAKYLTKRHNNQADMLDLSEYFK